MPVAWDEFIPVEAAPKEAVVDWSEFKPTEALQTPTFEAPPPQVTPEETKAALEEPWYKPPKEFQQPLFKLGSFLFSNPSPELRDRIAKGDKDALMESGIADSLAKNIDSLSTPENLTLMGIGTGIGALGSVARRGVAAAFAYLVGRNAPEIAIQLGTEVGKPKEEQDPKRIAELVTDAAITTGLTAGAGAAAVMKPKPISVEQFREQAKQELPTVPTPEVPSAIKVESPNAEVLREQKPEVELPQVGARNAQPEAPAEVQAPPNQGEVLLTPEQQAVEQARLAKEVEEPGAAAPELTLPVVPEKSAELQMALVPGAKEFIEQDVIPKTVAGAKAIHETMKDVESLLSSPTKSESARLGAGIIREHAAELAQKDVQARKAFETVRSEMASWKPNQSLQFIDRVESGSTSKMTPELQTVAQGLRDQFNERVREVRALGTGKLEHVIEDYFPHIWKKPNLAQSVIAKIMGKRPLMGPKSFLKKRTIPRTVDGVTAGLEPVTWNPIDLTLLKLHEMDRYVMGQKIMQEFKDKGLAVFSRSDIPPEGYAKVNDSVANVIEYRKTTKASGAPGAMERVLRGHWFVQEDAARVLNNFLSPGLERYAPYRALRWFGNNLNMANLGLSGYHFTFSMIDTSTSKLSLGIEQAAQGKLKSGATMARGVAGIPMANQLEAYLKGNKVLQEYSKPGSVGGEYTKIVDALLAGGGRVEMPQIFQNSTLKNFFDAAKSGNYPGAVLRAPFAAIHAVSYPLMNVAIPRLKLGVFTDMAKHEMERLRPNVTRDQFRAAMGKIWDSVDNRLGELVYDNLFWNKTLKDLSFLAVRSVGWNLGTVRELGGAVVDSAKVISRLKSGDPVVTRRMGYLVALPITVGLMGAIYQKLRTGQGPQELKDYFYPKTGNMLPSGEPERVSFPSYLKDIVSVKRHPAQTVIHKAHPSIGLVTSMLQNKDYYGTEIIHPDDPLIQKVKDELGFVVKSFVPYSASGAEKRTKVEPGIEPAVESFFGIMPLPGELTRTPAENLAIELMRDQMPQGSRTKEQAKKGQDERDAIGQMKMGRMTLEQAIDKGLVDEKRANQVQKRADTPYLEYAVSRLNASGALRVYEKATPKERETIADLISSKIDRTKAITEDERDMLRNRFDNIK